MAYRPEVDIEKCVGCGECVDICPVDVYELQDEKSMPVNTDECVGCESCIEVCEYEAITVIEIERIPENELSQKEPSWLSTS